LMSEPAIRRAVTNAKPVCLFAGDYGLEIYANSIGVSEDFLAKNPEVVKKFVRAALKGWKDALADPEEAARIEIQYVKALDPQIVIEEIQILKRIAITPDVEKNGFGYISTDRMKNTVDFINKNIEVPGDKLTAEQIYRPGYLPDVAIKPQSAVHRFTGDIGAGGRRLSGLPDRSCAGGRLLPRREFARRRGSQQLAQVASAFGSEHGFKSRLRLGPAFERRLQALLARLGQAQLLGTAIGCSRPDADQPVPLQRQDVASKRGAVHHHVLGKRVDRQWTLSLEPREDGKLGRAQAARRQETVVGLTQASRRRAHGEAVALLRCLSGTHRHRSILDA